MSNRLIVFSVLVLVLVKREAALPVIGPALIEARSKLPDDAFKMDMKNSIILKNEDYFARFVNVAKTPALTAADVQFNFVDLKIKPGKSFFRHTHPRSAEALFVVTGKLQVSFWFEGINSRIVRNIVNALEYAVVPQGLPHEVTCASKRECFFVVFFRSSDPGLIPAPLETQMISFLKNESPHIQRTVADCNKIGQ